MLTDELGSQMITGNIADFANYSGFHNGFRHIIADSDSYVTLYKLVN